MNLNLYLLLGTLAFITSCASTENQNVEKPTTIPQTQVDHEKKLATVSGVVAEIQNGKDGYTALLTATDGIKFYVTISRANLTDSRTYRMLKTGDLLSVKGDYWQLDGKNQITVREFL